MEVVEKINTKKVLKDIIELYSNKLLGYQKDQDKELAISLLNASINLIKENLKDKHLSRIQQLDRINTLHEFTRQLNILTMEEVEITQPPKNIENYPPYHLHKKSQSAFGKVK